MLKNWKSENKEVKNWAIKLKNAEPHFIACANYCKQTKQLLKDLDSANSSYNTSKYFEIVGDMETKWEKIKKSREYLTKTKDNEKINNNINEIFKSEYENEEQLKNYLNVVCGFEKTSNNNNNTQQQ